MTSFKNIPGPIPSPRWVCETPFKPALRSPGQLAHAQVGGVCWEVRQLKFVGGGRWLVAAGGFAPGTRSENREERKEGTVNGTGTGSSPSGPPQASCHRSPGLLGVFLRSLEKVLELSCCSR